MSMLLLTRRLAGGLLVLAAVLVWFLMAPDDDGPSYDSLRSAIESDDDGNNELAEGAPQQSVVNGWTANKYLALISMQVEDAEESADPRAATLLLLGVIGLAVLLVTSEGRSEPARAPTTY